MYNLVPWLLVLCTVDLVTDNPLYLRIDSARSRISSFPFKPTNTVHRLPAHFCSLRSYDYSENSAHERNALDSDRLRRITMHPFYVLVGLWLCFTTSASASETQWSTPRATIQQSFRTKAFGPTTICPHSCSSAFPSASMRLTCRPYSCPGLIQL